MSEFSLLHVSRPASSGAEPHPTLVLLHGLGADEHDLMSISPRIDSRLYVLSLRAPLPYRWGGYSWFDYEREGPGVGGSSFGRSMQSLLACLQSIPREFPADEKRIYVGGFSMGAAMAGAFSLQHPGLAAGTLMMSGFLPPDVVPARYRPADLADHPIFLAHGTRDPVVPITFAWQARDYLTRSAADVTYHEYPIGHEISAEELGDLNRWLRGQIDTLEYVAQP